MDAKYNPAKMALAYLTLWKAIDIFFPENRWSEIVADTYEEMAAEVHKLLKENDLSWAKDPGELRYHIESTFKVIRALHANDKSFLGQAASFRDLLRDSALKYAGEIQLVASAGSSSVGF